MFKDLLKLFSAPEGTTCYKKENLYDNDPVLTNIEKESDKKLKKQMDTAFLQLEKEREKYDKDYKDLEYFLPEVSVKNYASGPFLVIQEKAIPVSFIESVEPIATKNFYPKNGLYGAIESFEWNQYIKSLDSRNEHPIQLKHGFKRIYYNRYKNCIDENGQNLCFIIVGGTSCIEITMHSGQKNYFYFWDFQTDIALDAIRHAWLHLETPYGKKRKRR